MRYHYERFEDDEDDGLLQDGERRRVPLTMMDSVQRSVAAHSKAMHDGEMITDASAQPTSAVQVFAMAAASTMLITRTSRRSCMSMRTAKRKQRGVVVCRTAIMSSSPIETVR